MLERILALLMLIILIPVLIVIIILIIVDDGLPLIFAQKRVGVNNTFFKMYKFRTMKKATPNVATDLLKNPNQYLLSTGVLLRKLSLDELPNLWNILKGDMVFVGPRPALHNQDNLIHLRITAGVDSLKPGLTGWAQINGRDKISLEEKVSLDKIYLEKKSFMFDIKILIMTFSTAFIKQEGVSH